VSKKKGPLVQLFSAGLTFTFLAGCEAVECPRILVQYDFTLGLIVISVTSADGDKVSALITIVAISAGWSRSSG
jgi:hypothetical protein